MTETCDVDTLHVITHIKTTPATTNDNALPEIIHADLAAKQLLPREHYLDTAYVSAAQLVASRTDYAVTLVGPVPQDVSWQAQAHTGDDLASFAIDGEQQTVTCPQGATSLPWRVREDAEAQGFIEVRMPPAG